MRVIKSYLIFIFHSSYKAASAAIKMLEFLYNIKNSKTFTDNKLKSSIIHFFIFMCRHFMQQQGGGGKKVNVRIIHIHDAPVFYLTDDGEKFAAVIICVGSYNVLCNLTLWLLIGHACSSKFLKIPTGEKCPDTHLRYPSIKIKLVFHILSLDGATLM